MATEKSVMAIIRASRPTFKNPSDKLAFAVHASFVAAGFILTAAGPSSSDSNFSSSSLDEASIDGWNDNSECYEFVYSNPERGFNKVLVKCLVMNAQLMVNALAADGSEPVEVVLNVADYVAETESSNFGEQFKNLDKLVKSFDEAILSKLSSKDLSSERRGNTPAVADEPREIRPGSTIDDPRGIRLGPRSGIADPMGFPYPAVPYGHSDLVPGLGAGMYPHRGDRGGDGGMLLGPNDPLWGRFGGAPGPSFPRVPPGVPPGARFDPYGPPGVPGFEPNRFGRNRPRPGNGIDPDIQHFPGGPDFI